MTILCTASRPLTDRVELQPIGAFHAAALERATSHPEVSVPVGLGYPLPDAWAQTFIDEQTHARLDGTAYSFAAVWRGKLVGVTILDDVCRRAEITFWIDRRCWGHGLGAQVVGVTLEPLHSPTERSNETSR